MKRRRNPFPGVSPAPDRHGKRRWRLRLTRGGVRIDTYLPGAYGSAEFRAAYEAALAGARAPERSTAQQGSLAWLVEHYLRSPRFRNLSASRKRSIRRELDWLRREAGDLPFPRLEVRHVEALMARKAGPTAANTVKKNLSMLFNFAIRKLGYRGPNPARFAERMKTNADGYHTWTDDEINRFLERHGPASKARLVMLLALNTGMARQDLARAGWQNIRGGRITYSRLKTAVAASLPILPELAEELWHVPGNRLLFITQEGREAPYTAESLGNWFHDRCREAKVPGSLHGLRKAGATRLADAGATEWEIAAYLAHKDTKMASVYARKANRARLADSGFAKLSLPSNVSNLPPQLDKGGS